MNPSKLFLYDAITNERHTYGELIAGRTASATSVSEAGQSMGLWGFCLEFLNALSLGYDVTLVEEGPRWLVKVEPTREVPVRIGGPEGCVDGGISGFVAALRTSASKVTLHTSGSTGVPKAVRQTMQHLTRAVRSGDRHSHDVWGFAYHPCHVAGIQIMLQAVLNGNTLVNVFGLPREAVFRAVRELGVTHLSATPTFYRMLLPADTSLGGVRSVALGGERTDPALLRRLRLLFPDAKFRNVYASTEACTLLASQDDVFVIPPDLFDRVEIRDGRLHVHRSLLGDFDEGSAVGEWYDTGDRVERVQDDSSRFRFVSRERDWLNVGGNKVNPVEVECLLAEHPGVREVRVYGQPNSLVGTILCAEYVPIGEEVPEQTLRQHLVGRVAPYEMPRIIRAVERLERTHTGKVRR